MKDSINSLEEIYIAYKSHIYSYLYNHTNNPQVSEELCQEVFLKAFKGLSSFKGRSSIKTWLYRIAHNEYVSWCRKEVKYKCVSIEGKEAYKALVENKSPLDIIESYEEAHNIKNVLSNMNDEYRSVLILCDLHNLSYKEISNILQCSLSKVKITIYRARIKFRQLYEKAGEKY
ncbi:RNA polymerase sigma factor [Paramaledivibacter caminithermalis]|uniref:RNA polymerase sigma-70 factor, ECF subfamily n=1 Tax=Paramaledivibacter caminithermalis (strain DSM 15212 / CIP 107654 / DViRD3) TaxID=1121301 RepID=A0A1M6K240_PARC5|nr:RNA polymerase sigma factor [Paramaledivibacter caminithermalis]SHJ53049.1 RNA polymerase sigma-70 factor, ECF subfamily [Paramaledivibacter caminithermalis DSM 15212]